jgi:hypothetical protein
LGIEVDIDMRKLLAALTAALACAAGVADAEIYSPAAQHVLARARAATGGDGWNILRGMHETGQLGGVHYERWLDPLRYGARLETYEPKGKHVHGFNGGGDWQILPDGAVTGVDDRATVAQARTDAFFAVNAFFYTGRFDAHGVLLGVRKVGNRAFDVVQIQPVGGKPRELWFDRRTHLLGRIVDRTGPQPVTVEVSDYRRVGPVLVAFTYATEGGGPAHTQDRQIESLDFRPADRSLFSLPRPPAPQPAVSQPAAQPRAELPAQPPAADSSSTKDTPRRSGPKKVSTTMTTATTPATTASARP